MKKSVLAIAAKGLTAMRQAHVSLIVYADTCTARERRLMAVGAAGATFGIFFSGVAQAASGGIAGMADTTAGQTDSLKASGAKILTAAGFGGAAYGVLNWIRKGKEGEQSHIKPMQIVIPIVAGAAAASTGFMLIKAGETVGIQQSSMGVVPN